MAVLMRHGVFKTVQINNATTNMFKTTAGFATKAEKKKGVDRKVPPKIDSSAQSIAAKGFLRPQRPYNPPNDVDAKIDELSQRVLEGQNNLGNFQKRFELFQACAQEFNHSIPNSLLYKMESLDDVKLFYKTPVEMLTPFDKICNMDLPKNLHVQSDYHRFHPETDTMFNGQTAFNRSSTLVTGLKYKDKYKGHIQNQSWPFNS